MFIALRTLATAAFGDDEEMEITRQYHKDICKSEDIIDVAQANLDYTDRMINHKIDKLRDFLI